MTDINPKSIVVLDLEPFRTARFSSDPNVTKELLSIPLEACLPAAIRGYTKEALHISPNLIRNHWLQGLITQKAPIVDASTIDLIIKTLAPTMNIHAFANGAIPASTNPESSYYNGTWRRDNAVMQMAMLSARDIAFGDQVERTEVSLLRSLVKTARFDNRLDQRWRFTDYLFLSEQPEERRALAKVRFNNQVKDLPRNKASVTGDGSMGDYVDWGHNQLDGFGAATFMFFRAANEGVLDLKKLDPILNQQNPHNRNDSIFSVYIQFLELVEFWDQVDLGPWEKEPQHKRASSLGICLAAFKEAKLYFEKHHWDFNQTFKVSEQVDLQKIIDRGIRKGEEALMQRVPMFGMAKECDQTPDDAALTFLLLFNPGLSDLQEVSILSTVSKLFGEYGIRRMLDNEDYFMGTNHILNAQGDGTWGVQTQEHMAAQWSMFDPLLAAHFYNKFIESDGHAYDAFLLADVHAKRTLAQITKSHHQLASYRNDSEVFDTFIPAGTLPEARFKLASNTVSLSFDRNDRAEIIRKVAINQHPGEYQEMWLPNTNSPLQMAHAAFMIMIAAQMRAIDHLKLAA